MFALGCTYLEMAYRICDISFKKYVNPGSASMWSYQANLDSLESWLAPVQRPSGEPRTRLVVLVRELLERDPKKRPTINAVIFLMLRPASITGEEIFGPCCSFRKFVTQGSEREITDVKMQPFERSTPTACMLRIFSSGVPFVETPLRQADGM